MKSIEKETQGNSSTWAMLKKTTASLQQPLSQHAKACKPNCKRQDEPSHEVAPASSLAVRLSVCFSNCEAFNVKTDLTNWGLKTAVKHSMPKEMAEVSEKCQGGKRFYEWLWSGLDADDTKQEFIGVVPNIGLGASLTKSIKALRSTPIWLEKATTGIAKRFVDCMTGMCKTQGYVTRGNFACCEVLAFGAA